MVLCRSMLVNTYMSDRGPRIHESMVLFPFLKIPDYENGPDYYKSPTCA